MRRFGSRSRSGRVVVMARHSDQAASGCFASQSETAPTGKYRRLLMTFAAGKAACSSWRHLHSVTAEMLSLARNLGPGMKSSGVSRAGGVAADDAARLPRRFFFAICASHCFDRS